MAKVEKSKTPQLRFPEFSGEWEKSELGDIADVKGGKRMPKGKSLQDEESNFPYLRVSDMTATGVSLDDLKYVPENIRPEISKYTISSDDIYVSVAGTLGLVGVVPPKLDGANLTENADKITNIECDQNFLLHLLKADPLKRLIHETKTINAQPKLAIYALKGMELTIPEEREQKKIADFLSSVDEWIENLKKRKAKLQEYKRGLMQKLFPAKGESTPELRFPEFSGEWKMLKLKDLEENEQVEMSRGKVISKKDLKANPGNFPVYSSSTKNRGLFGKYGEYMFNESMITWSVDGGGDFFYRPKHKFSVTNVSGYIKVLSDDVSIKFLVTALQRLHRRQNFDYTRKAHPSVIRSLYNIRIPSIKEQKKIADFLSEIDTIIEKKQEEIYTAKKWKRGLMQKMFV